MDTMSLSGFIDLTIFRAKKKKKNEKNGLFSLLPGSVTLRPWKFTKESSLTTFMFPGASSYTSEM